MNTPKKKGPPGKYAPKLKVVIAREYFNSDLGYSALGKKYNIPAATIQEFIKWYKKKYPDGMEQLPDKPDKGVDKNLQQANLKITALEMLIENASKELGIDLVKKFGTKQSGK